MDPIISRLPSTLIPGGELRICPHSGIAWQPDPQPIIYDEAYFDKYVGYEGTDIAHDINYARMLTVFELLGDRFDPRSDAPDTLVDVGIGSGEFLSYLIERHGRGHHLTLYGYDVNAAGVEWLRERDLFCDIYHPAGAFSRAAVPVVTAWDVSEHIPEIGRAS
jgi:hypothetical protein